MYKMRDIAWRFTSLALAAVMVCCLAACGGTSPSDTDVIPSGVTIASSDAESFGKWLGDRLESIPNDVVIGIGDNQKYNVDMTDFENDGYIIKNNGNEVVIFGKTSDGLDRGVRKYANTVDSGAVITDITYHEGARIEELRLFGADISEFVINYPAEANENMKFAASELAMLIEKATGVKLATEVGDSSAARRIEIRFSEDKALGDAGYRYFEDNGNLVIEGAVQRGCMNGVYRFLQNECGWAGLIFGDSLLAEADLIEIKPGLVKSETPIFDYIKAYDMFWGSNYKTDRTEIPINDARNSYGPIQIAMHGMTTYKWADRVIDINTVQLCYTSEEEYYKVSNNVFDYIETQDAAGNHPGVQLKEIDIAQGDSDRYCMCSNCSEVYRIEQSNAGAMIRFANTLGNEINEKYPGANIGLKVFAYFSTKKPPAVTKANEYVYVSFAMNGNCSNHYLDGSECDPNYDENWSFYDASNILHSQWLEGWCEMAEHVYAWYYVLDSVLHQYTVLDLINRDFQYMKEIGVEGLFWQNTYHGFGIKRVEHQIGLEVNWNNDMTDEEYEEELCRILEREYGDGWQNIREYIKLLNEAQDATGCYSCWFWSSPDACRTYNIQYMSENYQKMADLLEEAIIMAGSAEQETHCKLLSCHIYYDGAFASYFRAYDENDTETIQKLSDQYEFMIKRVEELGFDINKIITVDSGGVKVYPTLEEEAWLRWIGAREYLSNPSVEHRPAPGWLETWVETTEDVAV